jgi:Amt family ammonium transporter
MNETIATQTSGSSLLYDTCYAANQGSEALTLQCIAATFEERRREIESSHFNQTTLTNWMLVVCGALVFFMQAGFAMVCAGSVRKKNLINTMLKNLLDACAAAIAFYTVGFGLAYGGNDTLTGTTFVGNSGFFGYGVKNFGFWFFQYAFSAATVTIVAGALAERCKMTAYFSYSLLLTGIVYPIVAHAVWSNTGLLSPTNQDPVGGIGYIDAAGSGAIHLCGGLTALIATSILGPRQGRFHDEEGNLLDEPKPIKGHSMALQLLGTLILWFGCK